MARRKSITRTVWHLFVFATLFGVVNIAPVSGHSLPVAEPEPSPVAQVQELSTPELIEWAFAQGEITAEQRLLYLAYAVYDYSSLPSEFHSSVPWFGTHYVQELKTALDAAASSQAPFSLSSTAQSELDRLLSPQAKTVCDQEDGPNSKESTNFHVAYGTITGTLTITDYLTSLDTAFSTEVTSYGWPKPPFCKAGTGDCTNTNPWGKYPVQVASLKGGLYGYVTYPAGSYTGKVGDNPNTAVAETDAVASCMVLNEDYSGFAVGAQNALDVTTAHEFNHAIQYATGDPGKEEDLMWYEASAVYMEDEVHDGINDNYQYLWPQFTSCLGEYPHGAPNYHEYSSWLFVRYAAEHNGGTNKAGGGEDIMQAFWANVAAGQVGLAAYNNALGVKGTNLADAFHNYAIATRFNKKCPTAKPYCYEEADDYVKKAGATTNHGNIAVVGRGYTGSIQDNYALNWIGLPKRGIYSISLENTSANGKFRASIVADTGTALQITPLPKVVGGNDRTTLAEYKVPSGAKSVVAVITNQSKTADDPGACTANPYRLSTAPPIAFVIDDTGSMGDEIDAVKTTVTQKVDEFVAKKLFPNYHLLTYKDNVTYHGATAVPDTIKSWVNGLSASGGGDCPEEMLGALNRIAQEAPHSEAWVMTDAAFHGDMGDLAVTIYNLIKAHVKVHPIIYGWCSNVGAGVTAPLGLGPESAAQIASETGGHYFRISSAETQAAASILLNEMVTTSDLTLYTDEVSSGSPRVYTLQIDSTTEEANFLLNEFSGDVSLALFDPDGVLVSPGDPGVIYTGIGSAEYYQIAAPASGLWQAQVSGGGTFAFSASGNSAISFEYLSDTSLPKNEPATILAALAGPVASAVFQFTRLDGTPLETVNLFDDGLHGDGSAADGIFGGTYTPTTGGSFNIRVRGTTTASEAFERVAPEIIRVQTLKVAAPAGRIVWPGASLVYEFSITNGGTEEDTFELTVSSSQGWADLSAVPTSVTIAAGATAQVAIPVNVPPGAAPNTTDEIILAAFSQTNPSTNDAGSVAVTVMDYSRIFLPMTVKGYFSGGGDIIHGTVTENGTPAAGVELHLRYYDGSTWSTYDATTTDSSGNYQFTSLPNLGTDQRFYVRWDNTDSNSNRLWRWSCSAITSSTTDPEAYRCNFDLDDVDLLSPSHGATVSLPYTFTWRRRVITTDDYQLNLADVSAGDPYWWTDLLGYVGSYALTSLPYGFVPGQQYGWWMWVYGPDGYGVSYYYRHVTFSNTGGGAKVQTVPMSTRMSIEDTEMTAPPQSR